MALLYEQRQRKVRASIGRKVNACKFTAEAGVREIERRSLRRRAAGCNRRSHWHRRRRSGGLLRRAELDEPPRDPSRDHREDEDDSDHHSAQYCVLLSRPDAIATGYPSGDTPTADK